MKTKGFQKTGGFKQRSETSLLVSLSDFVDKIYVKQEAYEISNFIIQAFKKMLLFNLNNVL